MSTHRTASRHELGRPLAPRKGSPPERPAFDARGSSYREAELAEERRRFESRRRRMASGARMP